MKHLTTILLTLCFLTLSHGQDNPFINYDFDASLVQNTVGNETTDILGLKEKKNIAFVYEGENFIEYNLVHKAYLLAADDKIEQYNKIYLPYGGQQELLESKARVISSTGNIEVISKENIFTAEDETTGGVTAYYALDGIDKGSIIEYFYILRKSPKYKGAYLRLQKDFDQKKIEFELSAPENLVFDFKSFNGEIDIVQDSIRENRRRWYFNIQDLKGLKQENLSAYEASKLAIGYRLDKNTATNATGISSYKEITKTLYNYFNRELDKKTLKSIQKFVDDIEIKSINDDEKIRTIDNYIKNNIFIAKNGGDQLSDLYYVIENKAANINGILRLYLEVFKLSNIETQIVITSDRTNAKFDKNYEMIDYLDDYLLYFPTTKKFLSPSEQESRYGFPIQENVDNYGLFISEISLGDFKSAVGKIKYIEAPEASLSEDIMDFDVRFNSENLSETTINLDYAISGYNASFIHPFMNLVKDKDKEEFYETFIKRMGEDLTINSKEVYNEAAENFGIKPLRVTANVTTEQFVQKAGKRFLFKVGELIGRQTELYQDTKRVLDIDNGFKKLYLRTINIKIPEGYKIANPDDIKINYVYSDNDKELMFFKSDYEIQDGKITITANEIYDLNLIPVSLYPQYRQIINGAADFNKVTLVFQPI